MSSKKIYLIRHGQTDYNKKGIVQGSAVNSSLNEEGRQQAAAFFQSYKDIPFQAVYTSALNRSIESVQDFIELGIEHHIRPGLNEISWGSMDGKVATTEEHTQYTEMLERWNTGDIDFKQWGGESPVDVQNRQQPVIDEMLNAPYDTILVCMHGRAIRILLSTLTGKEIRYMDEFHHANLCLYILEVNDKQAEITLANCQKHLD